MLPHAHTKILEKLLYFSNLTNSLNDDSDKKKIMYPFFKLVNIFNKKNILSGISHFYKFNSFNDISIPSKDNESRFFFDNDKTYKTLASFSSNQSILTASKSLRGFSNLKPNVATFNHSVGLNSLFDYQLLLKNNASTDNSIFYALNNSR